MANVVDVSILDITEAAAGNLENTKVFRNILGHLENIDDSLKALSRGGGMPSQANARTFGNNSDPRSAFRDRQNNRLSFGSGRDQRRGFMDSFNDSLLEGFIGSGFSNDVQKIFKGFANRLDTDIKGIPDAVGKQLGQIAANAFKSTTFGKNLTARAEQMKKNFLANLEIRGNSLIDRMQGGSTQQNLANRMNRHLEPLSQINGTGSAIVNGGIQGVAGVGSLLRSGLSAIRNAPSTIMSMFQAPHNSNFSEMSLGDLESSVSGMQEMGLDELAKSVGEPLSAVGDASTKLAGDMLGVSNSTMSAASGLAKLGPEGMAVAAALVAIEVVSDRLMEGFKDIGDGIKQIFSTMSKAANRDAETRKKNLELAKHRMEEDYKTMVEAPFKLLQEAANDLYSAWNQNLTTIAATQGYTKSDTQDLMAVYAQRIRNEGLDSYINSVDLVNNLSNVLKSGLAGAVAEEFTYQATLLNKAVPTQDFFQYASTYASIAANAERAGKSESEAINLANESLNSFASSLLYTSRELTGGFTTGLQNASSLYADASKIAVAANSNNIDAISSTLVAIQGYVGAVAPDLADSLTSTIYKLATGGNSAETVALRSLAGVNASNTEFLKALAKNPQSILATMFENLASMYIESPDAYMEKAEGYASLFGLDTQAFQRVDFNALADAIRNMNVTNDSLNANMELLRSGQTTTSTEQLRNRQITDYMIDEGLAYVIDNEVAQMIQQHMWDEQLQRELFEATFTVDLVGSSAEGILKIMEGVQKILNFLNPFGWLKGLVNVSTSIDESFGMQADVAQLLETVKVGKGSELAFKQLTTGNEYLGLTKSYLELLGGTSRYGTAVASRRAYDALANPLFHLTDSISDVQLAAMAAENAGYVGANRPTSRYNWGSVSKLQGQIASAVLTSGVDIISNVASKIATSASVASATASAAKTALDKMMDESYIKDEFVKQGKSYEDWLATSTKFGISDVEKAAEDVGYAMEDIKKFFEDAEAKAGQEEQHERDLREEAFWKSGMKYWDEYYPQDFDPRLFSSLDEVIENQYTWQESWNRWASESTYMQPWNNWIGEDGKSGVWANWAGDNGLWINWTTEFGKLKQAIIDYTSYKAYYGGNIESSTLLKRLEEVNADARREDRDSAADTMGKVLADTLLSSNTTDPALQTNVLLGQILVYLGQIAQQTNGSTSGGTGFIDTLAAMSLGLTTQTP